ncbi:MAG: hypothetical protein QXO16_04005 [Archaeoglobaceae archaeon]
MRASIFLFLSLTLLLLGCVQQGGITPTPPQTPAPTPTPGEVVAIENVSEEVENLEKEFQELEKFLNELESLENVTFET